VVGNTVGVDADALDLLVDVGQHGDELLLVVIEQVHITSLNIIMS